MVSACSVHLRNRPIHKRYRTSSIPDSNNLTDLAHGKVRDKRHKHNINKTKYIIYAFK